MIKLVKNLLQAIIRELSKDVKFSQWTSLIIQLISNIQITFLILQPSPFSNPTEEKQVMGIIQYLSSLTANFVILDQPEFQPLIRAFWFGFLLYSMIFGFLIFYVAIRFFLKRPVQKSVSSAIGRIFILHSKILFFFIQYFWIWLISIYNRCDIEDTNLIQCDPIYFILTIVGCFMNFLIAFSKELFFYQIKVGKDPFACKTNLYSQLFVIHKTIILIFGIIINSAITPSVVNLMLSLIYFYDVIFNLSVYNIFALKARLVYVSCHVTFSVVMLINSFGIGERYMGLMLTIPTLFTILFAFQYLNLRFSKILRLEFSTPQEAVHILVLLNQYTTRYSTVPVLDTKYREGSIYLYGLLKFNNIDPTQLKDASSIKEYNYQLYNVVLKRLNEMLEKFPDSEILVLVISQIYIKKIGNAARAITLLSQLEARGASSQALKAIRDVYMKLERIYNKIYSEEEMELLRYFEYRDLVNKIKEKIQMEVSNHIKLWVELSKELVNIKQVFDLADKIDSLFETNSNLWHKSVEIFDKVLSAPFLMYGVYMGKVRSNPIEAMNLVKKYYDLKKIKNLKQEASVFSEDSAIILGSIELGKPGLVIDSSSSVENLFNITREKLVGQKVDLLLPRFIAKKHDKLIRDFNKHGRHSLGINFGSYAKTVDGNFFPVDVKLKIYPYIDQGLNLISQITKLRDIDMVIMVDYDGKIVDCSEDLMDVFNLSKKDMDHIKITQICENFEEIEQAFQIFYGSEKDMDGFEGVEIKSSLPKDDDDSSSDESIRKIIPNKTIGVIPKPKEKTERKSLIQHKTVAAIPKTNDKPVKRDSLKSPLPLLGSPEMKESPSGDKLNQGRQSVYKPSAFQPRNSLFSRKPRQSISRSSASPFDLKVLPGLIAKKAAEETLNRAKAGTVLSFYPKKNNFRNNDLEDKLDFQARIEPYNFNGAYFNLIKFKDIVLNSKQEDVVGLDASPSPKIKQISESSEFVDSFPTVHDKSPVLRKFSLTKSPFHRDSKIFKNSEKQKKLISIKKILSTKFPRNGSAEEFSSQKEHMMRLQHNKRTFLTKKGDEQEDQGSTVASTNGLHIVKGLNNLFDKKKHHPMIRLSAYLMYLVMLLIILLVCLDYVSSDKSFKEMKEGIMIVNAATDRIMSSMVSWQYMLILYSRSVGLRPIIEEIMDVSKNKIYAHTLNVIQRDKELQVRLQNMGYDELFTPFFENNLYLWEPYANITFDSKTVNTFTGSKILSTKNFAIINSTKPIQYFYHQNDMLFNLNNTCNDFLIKSQLLIQKTESIVEDIIKANQNFSIFFLGMENFLLMFGIIFLLFVIRTIVLSFIRLFKALTKISPEALSYRLAELYTCRNIFELNVESKEFGHQGEDYFEGGTQKQVKKSSAKKAAKYHEDRFFSKPFAIYALRSIALVFILSLLVVGTAMTSYFKSTSIYNSLTIINQRLSIAHQLGYTFDMTLGTFYFNIIFQNETQFLVRDMNPADALDYNLDYLSKANKRIINLFSEPSQGITDPILENFLKADICSVVSEENSEACDYVTKGEALGLLGLNIKYYDATVFWVNQYRKNPTFTAAQSLLEPYASDITADLGVLEDLYIFLRNYLISTFDKKVNGQKEQTLTIFAIILVTTVLSTLIIEGVTIRKLRRINEGVRKILKIIPFNIIQETRSFKFYLKNEYGNELQAIKDFL